MSLYKIYKRLINEFYRPNKLLTKIIIENYIKLKRYISFYIKKDLFIAYYDMAVSGPSFDFSFFLAAADYSSKKKGFKNFYVVIFEESGLFYSEKTYSDMNSWKLYNIVIPMCSMYSNCNGFEYIKDKKDYLKKFKKNIDFYPQNYDFYNVKAFTYSDFIYDKNAFKLISGFTTNKVAKRYIKKNLNLEKKLISITIRGKSLYSVEKKEGFNSNIDEWIKACNYFLSQDYQVIIIPETFAEVPTEFIEIGCTPFKEGSFNLILRQACYEVSDINFFMPNGPASIAYLSKNINYIVFNFFTDGIQYQPGVEEASEKERFKQFKMIPGDGGWKFSNNKQIISKFNDKYENIIKEFEALEKNINHE
tara:strand:- start:13885 stop:14973 length:1089 start_codon:yes stop_codon:yes gene_type:complete